MSALQKFYKTPASSNFSNDTLRECQLLKKNQQRENQKQYALAKQYYKTKVQEFSNKFENEDTYWIKNEIAQKLFQEGKVRERQNQKIERHIAKLEEKVQHINKWQKFKEMRAAVIDKYMVLKRKQLRVYKLCSTIKLANIMLHLKEAIKFAD